MSSNIVGRARLSNLFSSPPSRRLRAPSRNPGERRSRRDEFDRGAVPLWERRATARRSRTRRRSSAWRFVWSCRRPPRYPAWNCGLPHSVSGQHGREDSRGGERPSVGLRAPALQPQQHLLEALRQPAQRFRAAQWVQFDDYEAVLAAGTYWVTFEPVAGTNLNYSVPNGAANPRAEVPRTSERQPWILTLTLPPPAPPQSPAALGVRVRGATFPGVAFGTATRSIFGWRHRRPLLSVLLRLRAGRPA